MSERKVLNKYFPPDFDPSVSIKRKGGNLSHTVRLMTPFSMRCNTCGEYIYRRKKFNARKEKVLDENYLGIIIFRFYIKCPVCSSSITFKTDPKNTDYVCENGAERNFEPWRDEKFLEDELRKEREAAEDANPMRALELRTQESKREMDILDALDEIRTKNAKSEGQTGDLILERMLEKGVEIRKDAREAEEDAYIKTLFNSDDGLKIKRIVDDEDPDDIGEITLKKNIELKNLSTLFVAPAPVLASSSSKRKAANNLGIVLKKKTTIETKKKETPLVVDYPDSD